MIINIGGKVSDLFGLDVEGDDSIDHNGYVPYGLGIGGGDYIEISIDVETGKILNWKPFTKEELIEAINNT